MDTRLFDYVKKINECGSFSKASSSLFISQQGLIRFIASSEKDLGFPIFHRTNKGVSLTKEGEIILETGEHISRQLAKMHRSLDDLLGSTCNDADHLTLYCDAYALLKVITNMPGDFFQQKDVSIMEASLEKSTTLMRESRANSIYLLSVFESVDLNAYLENDFVFEPLFETIVGVIGQSGRLDHIKTVASKEKVALLPLIKHEDDMADTMYDHIFRNHPLRNVRVSTRDSSIFSSWLERGDLVALSDSYSHFVRAKAGGAVDFVPIEGNHKTTVGFVRRKSLSQRSPAIQFVEQFRDCFCRCNASYLGHLC